MHFYEGGQVVIKIKNNRGSRTDSRSILMSMFKSANLQFTIFRRLIRKASCLTKLDFFDRMRELKSFGLSMDKEEIRSVLDQISSVKHQSDKVAEYLDYERQCIEKQLSELPVFEVRIKNQRYFYHSAKNWRGTVVVLITTVSMCLHISPQLQNINPTWILHYINTLNPHNRWRARKHRVMVGWGSSALYRFHPCMLVFAYPFTIELHR